MSTLSRHFYCLEEVVASLQYACATRQLLEAAFWLQELIDSGEASAAITAMVETCIYHCGVHGISWLRALVPMLDEPTEDDLYAACMSLCRIKARDYSFIGLHLLGDSGGQLVEPFASINAWADTDFAPCSLDILCKVAAAAALAAPPPSGHLPEDVMLGRERWRTALGRRCRREYAVTKPAVRIVTRRGRMSHTQSTIAELRQLGRQWKTAGFLDGCAAWEEMMDDAAFTEDDDAWERFCATAFPDDIPDEWSAEEQAKSHGPGLAGHPTITAARWVYYTLPSNEYGQVAFEVSHAAAARKQLAMSVCSNKQLGVNEFWTPAAWLAEVWTEAISAAFDKHLTL